MPTFGEFVALVFFGTIGVTLTAWGTVKLLNELYWKLSNVRVGRKVGKLYQLDEEIDWPDEFEGCECDECVAEREWVADSD